jgi:transposase
MPTAEGVYSSRRIAQACEERGDFMAVTAMNPPDFRTIATFRRRHLKALGDLFVQVLKAVSGGGTGQARAPGSRWHQGSGTL